LREIGQRLVQRSAALSGWSVERVARGIDGALALLFDPRTELGGGLRRALPESTGLTGPVIEWGIEAAFGAAGRDSMLRSVRMVEAGDERGYAPPRLTVVVLSGNLFTAPLRAVAIPLLVRSPVLAKASSADGVLPRFLKEALRESDPELAAFYEVVEFARDEPDLGAALFSCAEAVSVFGDDETVRAVRAAIGPGVRFSAHGHGLGAIYVPAACLSDEAGALAVVRAAALDVAAYDQRGCLSPHVVCVGSGGAVDGEGFANLMAAEGLSGTEASLPRGRLTVEAAAAQMQWRGVAAARGRLFAGDSFAVSYEGRAGLRPSPGFRNVGVYDCRGEEELADRLSVFGAHLKALGVAGGIEEQTRVAHALRPGSSPLVTAAGEMQRPAFDAPVDGEPDAVALMRPAPGGPATRR
jgi:hypothetical protein